MKLSWVLPGETDLEPGQDVEVLLHVSPKHLLNDRSPQGPMVSLGHFLYTSTV